jgi:phosphoglycerate dehydrogenase-like enzyme
VADRPAALFAMRARHLPEVFPPEVMRRLRELVDIDPGLVAERFTDPRVGGALATAEILITGWGCPPVDEQVLAAAPRLRAVVHAAGTVKSHVTQACWDRGLVVSSAAAANGVPVAEYTLASILFAGKGIFAMRERYRTDRAFAISAVVPGVGNFHRPVGIIGASRIGRRVIDLLHHFDLDVYLADPYVDPALAAELGVRLVSLENLLRVCDIVSVHAPSTPRTRGMLGPAELALMRDGAVLINTARGDLVDAAALVAELKAGRLSAVLDVTDPEPLPPESPLFDLPNVFLTPHVAGSHGNEVQRLGGSAVEEVARLVAGRPLAHPVHRHALAHSA